MKNCVFAGSFDPLTNGHEMIIEKCQKEYDNVFIVLGENPNKECFFSREERLFILNKRYHNMANIHIVDYATVKDYAQFLEQNQIIDYVRGIRNDVDLEYEKKAQEINKKLYPKINTRFIHCENGLENISSSMVRKEVIGGQDIEQVSTVVKSVIQDIIKKRLEKK